MLQHYVLRSVFDIVPSNLFAGISSHRGKFQEKWWWWY